MSEQKLDIGDMSFETAMQELESIVRRLEEGRVALEDAIQYYERGDALRKHCESRLKTAQMRVEKIVETTDAGVKTEPMNTGQ